MSVTGENGDETGEIEMTEMANDDDYDQQKEMAIVKKEFRESTQAQRGRTNTFMYRVGRNKLSNAHLGRVEVPKIEEKWCPLDYVESYAPMPHEFDDNPNR